MLALLLMAWPAPDATLAGLPTPLERPLKVYIDAGHGSRSNPGARGCFCQREQVHTARVAALTGLGGFEVRLSRTGDAGPSYPRRIAAAERWGANAIVSIHADVRGAAWP
jgi:N-acetylmuramoyl-L-alanine amidase